MSRVNKHNTYTEGVVYRTNLIDSATSTTTSDSNKCAGAKSITLLITAANSVSDRSGTLSVEVSHNDSDFHSYNMLISNVTNTNSQNLTRVSSTELSSDGTELYFFTPESLGGIESFRTKVTVSDGASPTGNFTVNSLVQY